MTPPSEAETGVVRMFERDKRFGFITADKDEADIFFHQTSVVIRPTSPLIALIVKEPASNVAETAEATDNTVIPATLDEATAGLGTTLADEARRIALTYGYTTTSIVDGAYAAAIREIRSDLLPPVPGPEC